MRKSAIARGMEFARDMRAIGLLAALQGARTLFGDGVVQVTIPGVGPVSVRQGDSDYSALRQIFVRCDYEIDNDTTRRAIERRYRAILQKGAHLSSLMQELISALLRCGIRVFIRMLQ